MTGRDRIILAVACVLASAAGSWFFLIGPKRDQAAKLRNQLAAVQSQLDGVRSQIAGGEAARHKFASSYVLMAKLGEAVPADDDVASLVWQLQTAAHKTGVDFRSLSLASGSGITSSTSSPLATQSATASLPPGATVGPAGLPIEPFTFTFQGNFFDLSDYLGRVQRFVTATNDHIAVKGRLLTLNGISLSAAPQGFPQITATISATTYLVPSSQGVQNGATPSGPATGSTTQASSPSTSPSTSATPAAVATPGLR